MVEIEITPANYPPWLSEQKVDDIPGWLLREHCTKVWGRCGERKPLSAFHRLSSSSDGRHSYCRVCREGGV
jgi:hypothetical protein